MSKTPNQTPEPTSASYLRYSIFPDGRTFKVRAPSGRHRFEAPATTKKVGKIYVLLDGPEILYVGQTSQSVGSRFRGAFDANGETGYYGYKWRDKRKTLTLLIWILPEFAAKFEDREAVEAELVFRIRRDLGYWPRSQNEMHFWNAAYQMADLAQNMFEVLKNESNSLPDRTSPHLTGPEQSVAVDHKKNGPY